MSYRSVLGGLAFAALVAGAAGCGDNKTNVSATSTTDNGQRLRVVGRVINAQSGLPVGATVEVCGLMSGSADSNGNFVLEWTGNLTDMPSADYQDSFNIRFSANGHATHIETEWNLINDETDDGGSGETDPGANSTTVVNMGTISLDTAFTQTLLITKDGQPLPNVQVIIGTRIGGFQNFTDGTNGVGYSGTNCDDTQVGTTNSLGVVTFSGLSPFDQYQVVVPAQNTGGDASPDFTTIYGTFTVQSTGGTFALDTDSTNFFTSSPEPIADNSSSLALSSIFNGAFKTGAVADTVTASVFDPNNTGPTHQDGTNITGSFDFSDSDVGNSSDDRMDNGSFGSLGLRPDTTRFSNGGLVTTPDGSVTLVFKSPVQVVQGGNGREVHFIYVDNMIDPRAANFNHRVIVTGTATQVENGLGSLWTFKPGATIPAYVSYSLQFTAHSAVDPSRVQNFAFNDEGYFRIPTGQGAISTAADNLNGKTGATSGTGTATTAVNLEFDRLVEGSYRVVEYYTDNVRVNFDGDTNVWSLDSRNSTLTLVNNIDGATATGTGIRTTGATNGIRFRVELKDPNGSNSGNRIFCGDNITGHKNQVRVAIVVQDIDGNRIDEIQDLDVK